MTKSVESAIDAYLTGNLIAAKEIAKRCKRLDLWFGIRKDYGRTHNEAESITDFLKGSGTFQAACDAEQTAKENRRK